MIRYPNIIEKRSWLWFGLLMIAGMTILLACATSRQATQTVIPSETMTLTVQPTPSPVPPAIQNSATPTKMATHTPPPSPTSTLTPKPTWTPFKKILTEYFSRYDKNATAEIPP